MRWILLLIPFVCVCHNPNKGGAIIQYHPDLVVHSVEVGDIAGGPGLRTVPMEIVIANTSQWVPGAVMPAGPSSYYVTATLHHSKAPYGSPGKRLHFFSSQAIPGGSSVAVDPKGYELHVIPPPPSDVTDGLEDALRFQITGVAQWASGMGLSGGSYTLHVTVDAYNDVVERDEWNNSLALGVAVL